MNFKNKTVLITGGSRGIGRAAALAFAEQGARVAVNFRGNNEAARQTLDSLPGEGHLAVKADIAHPEPVHRMVETVVEEFGRLDILVNNAGIFEPHPIDTATYQEWQESWRRTMEVNLIGAANACYCAAQQMIKQGGGWIVNISSRGAYRGEPTHPAYGASKAGLNALSQSLAQALAPYNIFVAALAPGFVETDMAAEYLDGPAGEAIRRQSPLNRVAQPREIAHAILFLASEQAAYTTGCVLDMNGASYLH
jgi:3-oxoacyl-[acyl-carrier protein] reductase